MKRDGKSLIELVAVMGVMAVLLLAGAKTLTFLMRADADGRSAVAQTVNRSQLAEEFRRDVHIAANAELGDAADGVQLLRLTLPDGSIVEYRPAAGKVQVAQMRDGGTISRRTFSIPDESVRFEVSGESPRWVSLAAKSAVDRSGNTTIAPLQRTTFRIEAVLGRDNRLTRTDEAKP